MQDAEKIPGEQAGLKVIMDMAKLNIPFQLTCTATSGKMIRENTEAMRRMVKAMAETVYYYKTRKDDVIKIMQKYTRGHSRKVLEEIYVSYNDLLVEDT